MGDIKKGMKLTIGYYIMQFIMWVIGLIVALILFVYIFGGG